MKWYQRLNVNYTLKISMVFMVMSVIAIFFFSMMIERSFEEGMLSKGKVIARSGAKMMGHLLENAVKQEQISKEDLFDTNYVPIPKTNPVQYHTKFDWLTDKLFPLIQEAFMLDEEVTFAAGVDRKGYLPSHNKKYSMPQTGNFDYDVKHSRTKRIFNDKVGATAAANIKEILVQNYDRDTGENMWDISAPIFVFGKHWGGFRVGFSKTTVQEKIRSIITWIIILYSIFIALMIIVVVFLIQKITGPVIKISKYAQKASDGDLTEELEIESAHNEIGLLATNFNKMIPNMRYILKQLKEVIDTIDYSGEKLNETMNDGATAINQQTASIAEVSSTMEELNSIAHEINNNSSNVLESLTNNISIAQQSRDALKALLNSINTISLKNDQYRKEVFNLKDKSERIEEVMTLIDNIADQTKLVAFNATIEAVGSGEMGKRFSIVAEEIRRLADNVTESTTEIKEMIKEIRIVTDNILESSKEETAEIKKGVKRSQQAGIAFDRVLKVNEDSYNSVKNISASISQQKEATEQVLHAIKDVSEGAIVLNERVDENVGHVNTFANLSNKLKTLIAQFKL